MRARRSDVGHAHAWPRKPEGEVEHAQLVLAVSRWPRSTGHRRGSGAADLRLRGESGRLAHDHPRQRVRRHLAVLRYFGSAGASTLRRRAASRVGEPPDGVHPTARRRAASADSGAGNHALLRARRGRRSRGYRGAHLPRARRSARQHRRSALRADSRAKRRGALQHEPARRGARHALRARAAPSARQGRGGAEHRRPDQRGT
jgi:hypothetical protein